MKRSSASSSTLNVSIPGVLIDIENRNKHLREQIVRNERERLELEEKLRSMMIKTMPNHKRRQVQHIQTYFNRLNRESQQAEQRNLNLLRSLTEAQQRLDHLHNETENLIRLKNDYLAYLEGHYPNWRRPISNSVETINEYDRLEQKIRDERLNNDGNLRSAAPVRQSLDFDSSMLYKRYEDLLKLRLDRSQSPIFPQTTFDLREEERSTLEPNDFASNLSRAKRAGSLRTNLSVSGLIFLIEFLENGILNMIDKSKIYADDKPSILQKTEIVNNANRQDENSLIGFDAALISMVIFDQLHSTIQRNTVHQCLLTEEILSHNTIDFDAEEIASQLPKQDQLLWLRLIKHFGLLLKQHIMDISTLVDKFALTLLTTNVQDLQIKAKSLFRHVMLKYFSKRSNIDDERFQGDSHSLSSEN